MSTIDSRLIWLPRFRQFFAKKLDYAFEGVGREVKVFNNGTVYWILATETKSNCLINTKYFPFDKHRCAILYVPEHSSNYFIKSLFNSAIISPYSQPNSDWKLMQHDVMSLPPLPYRDSLVKSIHMVDTVTGTYNSPATGIYWEFEFHRTPTMMVNSWLIPFIVMMLTSNFVFLITSSGMFNFA